MPVRSGARALEDLNHARKNFPTLVLGFLKNFKGWGGTLALQLEQHARERIDKLLTQAGWLICDASQVSIHSTCCGVAIREFLLPGHGKVSVKSGEISLFSKVTERNV